MSFAGIIAAKPILSAVRMTHLRWPVKPSISFQGHHGDDFTHATTSGLFAGVRARQLAERSVGYTAGFLPAPQWAMSASSSSLHCAEQAVALQFARTMRTGDDNSGEAPGPVWAAAPAAPGGPGGPEGPGGPGGPGGPASPRGPCGPGSPFRPGMSQAATPSASTMGSNVRMSFIALPVLF